jgi:hypothetical protein
MGSVLLPVPRTSLASLLPHCDTTCDRVTDTMTGRVSLAEAPYAEAHENIERVFRTDD